MFEIKACESRGIPLTRGPKAAYFAYAAVKKDTAIAGAEGRVTPIFSPPQGNRTFYEPVL
jgi:hypothetical protein